MFTSMVSTIQVDVLIVLKHKYTLIFINVH